MKQKKLRNQWTFWAGALLWPFVGIGMFLSGGQPANEPADYVAAGTFLFLPCYLASLLSMFSWVKLTSAALVVQNPGLRLTVPWSKVEGVTYRDGLRIRVAGRPEPVRSMAFQGSIVGRLAGWPSARKAAGAIEQHGRQPAANSAASVQASFPWRSHAMWIGIGWTLLVIVLPLLGRLSA